jgi:flagellar motor component MotA
VREEAKKKTLKRLLEAAVKNCDDGIVPSLIHEKGQTNLHYKHTKKYIKLQQ